MRELYGEGISRLSQHSPPAHRVARAQGDVAHLLSQDGVAQIDLRKCRPLRSDDGAHDYPGLSL